MADNGESPGGIGDRPNPTQSSRWVTRGMVGILLATFFSDVGHEMATAVLPLYLLGAGLGGAALGLVEGTADLLLSLAKLTGGLVGHGARRKQPLATAGYLATTLGNAALALTTSVPWLATFRSVAWMGRGFRSPLRDFLLSDEVGPRHYGRAHGLERSADMLGALVGPLLALWLLLLGGAVRTVVLVGAVPSLISVLSIGWLTRDRRAAPLRPGGPGAPPRSAPWAQPDAVEALRSVGVRAALGGLPAPFWRFLVGVSLFGCGDFSRTFLILIAARTLGLASLADAPVWLGLGAMPLSVVLYAAHNGVSALAAYPIGRLGDRLPKVRLLLGGYGLGVVTNGLLAVATTQPLPPLWRWGALVVVTTLSGIYIAAEETLEKAAVAERLPRELRTLGFGLLAVANAAGDLGSSLYVGWQLQAGRPGWAFLGAATMGALGVVWLVATSVRTSEKETHRES